MRKGFTFIELIFVIMVIGIIAKFGTSLFVTAHVAAASTSINNRLHSDTDLILQQISNRLQYRIKESVVTRTSLTGTATALASTTGAPTILEWIGYDIDGWLGIHDGTFNKPTWSGFIDVSFVTLPALLPNTGFLASPGTNTADINTTIQAINSTVGGGGSGISNSAVFFTGANSDVSTDYGWNTTTALGTQADVAAHRITSEATVTRLTNAATTNFAGTDVYENYKLAWTAYALELNPTTGNLFLHYDYQPWEGERPTNANGVLLLQNVDTFKFVSVGDSIQVQVCVNDANTLGEGLYAICKEISIF